jgi:hypothetical protein
VPLEFPLSQLSSQAKEKIRLDVQQHTVTLVVAAKHASHHTCAGVLVRAKDRPGILTANHVWKSIETSSRSLDSSDLQIMLGGKAFVPLNSRLLSNGIAFEPALNGPRDLCIPDLAFIPLSDDTASLLSAKTKTFYSLDKRRDELSHAHFVREGVFVATGTPMELVDRAEKRAKFLVFLTNISEVLDVEDWDIVGVNLDLDSNPALPHTMGGMSGGGLWRIPISKDAQNGEFVAASPVLSGIIYGETELQNRKLLAHGPRSIHRVLYATNA